MHEINTACSPKTALGGDDSFTQAIRIEIDNACYRFTNVSNIICKVLPLHRKLWCEFTLLRFTKHTFAHFQHARMYDTTIDSTIFVPPIRTVRRQLEPCLRCSESPFLGDDTLKEWEASEPARVHRHVSDPGEGGKGEDICRKHWTTLNRLRTGVGRYRASMKKCGLADSA